MINKTVTTIADKYIDKGKKVLYLVLNEKKDENIIIEDLQNELYIKMQKFTEKNIEKIKKAVDEFEDIEASLKYIFIKALIKILEKMIEENKGKLSEKDKKVIENIMKEDNDHKNDNEKSKKTTVKRVRGPQYPFKGKQDKLKTQNDA